MNYPENFLVDILGYGSEYNLDEFEETYEFLKVKAKLKPRYIEIIQLRYKDMLTLEEIGKIYSLTRERVRQIILTAIRKLKKKENAVYFIYGINGIKKIEKQNAFYLTNIDADISELELSYRSYHFLIENGITNVNQLAKMDNSDIMKIRNLGKKCADEIIVKLGLYGIKRCPRTLTQDIYEILTRYELTKEQLIEQVKNL